MRPMSAGSSGLRPASGRSSATLLLAIWPQLGRNSRAGASQIILRWHIQNGTIAIPKSASEQRMSENIDLFDFALPADELTAIDALDKGADGRVGPDPDTYEGV